MKAIAYNSLFVLCTVDTIQLHMPVSKLVRCPLHLSQLTPLSLSPVLFVSACPRHHEFIISSIVMFANSDVNASYSISSRVLFTELPCVKLYGDMGVVDLLLHFGFVGRHLSLVGMRSSNAESWQMTSRPFLANLSNGPSCRSSLLQAAVVAGVLCWVVAFASKAAFELGALLSESHCLARLHEPV